MSKDQSTQQDPTEQHEPAGEGQTIQHPGLTGDMGSSPTTARTDLPRHGRLERKKAVITGGDSGIGRAVALAFAREGADVLISTSRRRRTTPRRPPRWSRDAGRRSSRVPGDIREEQHCREVMERGRSRARRPRHAGQQRGLPDVAGRRDRSASAPSSSTGS